MRAYNPSGSAYNSLATAANKESQPGACVIAAAPISTNFVYTSTLQTFTVPAGVTTVALQVRGGRGGHCGYDMGGTGGNGGYAKDTLAVNGGEVLNITVGANGTDINYTFPAGIGSSSQINRPAASALLLGTGGFGGGNSDDGATGQGYTYTPVSNPSTAADSWTNTSGSVTVAHTTGV